MIVKFPLSHLFIIMFLFNINRMTNFALLHIKMSCSSYKRYSEDKDLLTILTILTINLMEFKVIRFFQVILSDHFELQLFPLPEFLLFLLDFIQLSKLQHVEFKHLEYQPLP
jgi:hypothetical protein